MKYDEILTINGSALTKHYIQSLNKQERENLIEPIFQEFRKIGFLYPDDSTAKLKKDYQRLIDYQPDVDTNELFNNSSLATNVCRYFCRSFFNATDTKAPTMMELFNNDEKLRKTIRNRLGLDWLESDGKGPGVNESFNLSFRMLIQGFRSQRLTATISMFKPNIAKYLCTKYSNVGDTVGDYSCGFGGRLLGAMSCQRKYIGTDPLTTEELEVMAKFYNFKDYTLIKSGSENYRGDPNSVDLYYSSPPYWSQEVYSKDSTQAYNQGEDYFYNIYWKNTLENVKYMLKPGKIFGLNVINYPKMVEMAKEIFGEPMEEIKLRTVRSHLNKSAGTTKYEPIYIFKK